MYRIKTGTPAEVVQPDGSRSPFYTRRPLEFTPNDRVKGEKDKIAFRRSGIKGCYIIFVETNRVEIPGNIVKEIIRALPRALEVCDMKDRELIYSLSLKSKLTTAQALFAANLIRKYRSRLPAILTHLATKLLPDRTSREERE